MSYAAFAALGVLLAFLAARRDRPRDHVDAAKRAAITLAAVVGAAIGAHGLAAIAAANGWIDGVHHAQPLGDRTVLGGLLGGWLAVEIAKRAIGERAPTGDRFAAPIAIALACGRLGCWSAGCCGGAACADDAAWRPLALVGGDGLARVPVQLIEAAFHALAALALLWAARRDALPGRRLCVYLVAYAALRFTLETTRGYPAIALGLTWFQWLALALAVVAGATWWRRSRVAAGALAAA